EFRRVLFRSSNPNTSEFIDKVCDMEGAESGFAFASGMAAAYSTLMALLEAGDHVVSCKSVFGATNSLFNNYFPKWNIENSYFDVVDQDSVEGLIRSHIQLIFLRCPSYLRIDALLFGVLGIIPKKLGLYFTFEQCFATNSLQHHLNYWVDLVIHSSTQLIDGLLFLFAGTT